MTDSERRTYAVVSTGLWRLRSDISQLLQARIVLWPWGGAGGVDGFVGWGRRPSGLRATALASRLGKPAITIEDGFLKGFWPGQEEPSHSFVVDRRGIYFETMLPNDLDDLLRVPDIDPGEELRASSLIHSLRSQRLTKYNNGPMIGLRQAGIPAGKPFVLLVDQVAGDASIAAAGAESGTFARMLEHAAAHNPGKAIVVRTHPAAGDRSLLRQAAQKSGIPIVVPERMNPWPLIEEADSVYTVSSQLGFEALMAGRPVHCFGVTYYSGRGVTTDHGSRQVQRPAATVEQIFHAAFLRYSSYLDLHTRLPCSLEDAIEQAVAVRDQRNRIDRKVYTAGFSPWKRRATTPFLRGAAGAPVHCRRATEAAKAAHRDNGIVAVWGSERSLPPGVDGVRLEDGFIRSKGLGVNLTYPSSLALDGEHVYYDARGESELERIISTHDFEEALLARSRDLVRLLVERGVSKYNLGTIAELPAVEEGRLKILVPGQVEQDASIRYGSPIVRSNAVLVSAVRERYPGAFVVYKEHPDVTSGLRSGDVSRTQQISWCEAAISCIGSAGRTVWRP
ncbi:capsular polysaccharide biosynthesis protein [Sinorhizobium sp. BG8]|uniref:capsular polysaccharide biosynthesis protein n=1 Tax=Sinorhizobium sp. BG8 TaxID=2613773 RepID=UPI00193CDD30|nr:capsular polysaccharide biosynthesis protein [Sinorhizobium sp. BG8]QRM56527.1 capsular polysaccharide biosynthesis protein [Sinorhizobium sp. BG8]